MSTTPICPHCGSADLIKEGSRTGCDACRRWSDVTYGSCGCPQCPPLAPAWFADKVDELSARVMRLAEDLEHAEDPRQHADAIGAYIAIAEALGRCSDELRKLNKHNATEPSTT